MIARSTSISTATPADGNEKQTPKSPSGYVDKVGSTLVRQSWVAGGGFTSISVRLKSQGCCGLQKPKWQDKKRGDFFQKKKKKPSCGEALSTQLQNVKRGAKEARVGQTMGPNRCQKKKKKKTPKRGRSGGP